MQTGERYLIRGTIRDEQFAVIEIDFSKNDKTIVRKFREWLQKRCESLTENYPKENQFFIFSRKNACVGQRGNKRTYEALLKNLAARQNETQVRCKPVGFQTLVRVNYRGGLNSRPDLSRIKWGDQWF